MLTSLTLSMSCTPLLKTLSTPILTHFALEFPTYGSASSADIRSFLRKFATSLTRLKLSGSPLKEQELIDLFKTLPLLTELQLVHGSWDGMENIFSEVLFNGLHSSWSSVLPQLQTLSITGDLSLSWESLIDLLESRCPEYGNDATCGPLRSVQLHLYTPFEVETKTRFEALTKRGMHVDVFELMTWVAN
ncbi:hypothetical protein C8F04DRAFT_1068907 [Mycena alexandri]|uniref:Uncharacterized protein n=1 Tax=Mycena alexandri TaxID=1745969 RepID=A0AAD6TG96_9AGAR|nr:hypothetical protein C8F04DRAFT_1068907 [Mycena alexandri]